MEWREIQASRLGRVFLQGFSAMDLAEPLVSFDAEAEARAVRALMEEKDFDVVGVREEGLVSGYVRQTDLVAGRCGDFRRSFSEEDDLVPAHADFTVVVASLAINERCFVTVLDRVGGIITLRDLEKPPMRMFLFGVITIGEMLLTAIIRHRYGDGSWQERISPPRLERARQLQAERARRGQTVDLVDCLQYGDKGWVLSYDEDIRTALGLESRRAARKALKEMETLRNNLAHTQEIVPEGWERIVVACSRFEQNLVVLTESMALLSGPSASDGQRRESETRRHTSARRNDTPGGIGP